MFTIRNYVVNRYYSSMSLYETISYDSIIAQNIFLYKNRKLNIDIRPKRRVYARCMTS